MLHTQRMRRASVLLALVSLVVALALGSAPAGAVTSLPVSTSTVTGSEAMTLAAHDGGPVQCLSHLRHLHATVDRGGCCLDSPLARPGRPSGVTHETSADNA